MINTMALYHSDGITCADLWSCARDDHTTVPPKCGVLGTYWTAACEFPAGHPGPHLPAA